MKTGIVQSSDCPLIYEKISHENVTNHELGEERRSRRLLDMSLHSIGKEDEDGPILLSAHFDHRESRFDEAAPWDALWVKMLCEQRRATKKARRRRIIEGYLEAHS